MNPETGSIISQFLAPGTGGGYEGAGLAIDKGGDLWCISQVTHMVYLVESGVPAYQWLTVTPDACTLGVGETKKLEVRFDATGLFGGNYSADILIQSNDCDQPSLAVPASLHVTGAPEIVISEDTLDYSNVFIGASVFDTLIVFNEGTDLLTVSNISSDNSDYAVDTTSFALNPEESHKALVAFTPSKAGDITGTLTMASNDLGEPTLTVVMRGEGTVPPDIAISPDSLSAVLISREIISDTLTVSNAGISDLLFNISLESRVRDSASLHTGVPQLEIDGQRLKTDFSGSNLGITGNRPLSNVIRPEGVVKVYASSQEVQSTANCDIAVLGADGEGGIYLNNVAQYLINSGRFASVTTINGYYFTPTLSELQLYDAVVVFSWYYWSDPVAIGNVLADFVDSGGKLLVACFANLAGGGFQLSGRFHTQNYWLMQPFSCNGGGYYYSMGTVYDPNHPIMKNVGSVVSGSKLNSGAVVNPGAMRLADFADGTPLVVVSKQSGNRRVDISFPPFTSSVAHGWGIDPTSDATLLIVNALEWLTGAIKWLSVNPSSGIVSAGSNVDVSVTFDAPDTSTVDYLAEMVIASNDPDEGKIAVPVHMRVVAIGDVNADFKIDLTDIIYLANYLLRGELAPKSLLSADVFCDSHLDLTDVIWLANHVIKGWTICEPH